MRQPYSFPATRPFVEDAWGTDLKRFPSRRFAVAFRHKGHDLGETVSIALLGRWNVWAIESITNFHSAPDVLVCDGGEIHFGLLNASDLEILSNQGPDEAGDAEILAAADLAIVGRNGERMPVYFSCAALRPFSARDIPNPVSAGPDNAYLYHDETAIPFRRMGIGRAGNAFRLRALAERGVTSAWLLGTEDNSTQHRILDDLGYARSGELSCYSVGSRCNWISASAQSIFASEPAYRGESLEVHVTTDPDLERLHKELDATVAVLAEEHASVCLFGSGNEAKKLLEISPVLKKVICGVVDSQVSTHGTIFRPTGHTIGPPQQWADSGATHLLYASKAYQDEMADQHQQLGPTGSRSIRIYPRVEVS